MLETVKMLADQKIAFVFSGQGAQQPGMGLALYQHSPAAKRVFDMADRIRPGTSEQCFRGTKELLSQTINTQPCLFTVDLAAAAALREAGIRPIMAAGFSLGEIAALAFSGALTEEAAFTFVCRRAEFMHEAACANAGVMGAVLGLSAETVQTLAAAHCVFPVNYNCPGQIVAAGTKEAMALFAGAVKEAGGKLRMLNVSGAFHSCFMDAAAGRVRAWLASSAIAVKEPEIPVYANYTAAPYQSGAAGAALLADQVNHPVLWQTTVERMAADGAEVFIETGEGKVLCGLIGKTLPQARTLHYSQLLELSESM